MDKDFDKRVNRFINLVPKISVVVFFIVIAFYAIPRAGLTIGTDPDKWGTFGDYVGGLLNPLFGIFTLMGLVITLKMQKEILDVQKQELAATRDELKKSAEALEIQNKTMLSQNFEGTFFQMLRRQSELLNAISFQGDAITLNVNYGTEAVSNIVYRIKQRCIQGSNFQDEYHLIYRECNPTLGPYFRNLYHTLKLIHENQNLTQQEKVSYSSLFRAQFSSKEVALIFYNCLSEMGLGLKPLIVEYRMLKHIDAILLADPEWLNSEWLYPFVTYQSRS